MTFRVPRGRIPSVDGDEDFLGEEGGGLTGAETDTGEETGDGGGEDGLEGEGGCGEGC